MIELERRRGETIAATATAVALALFAAWWLVAVAGPVVALPVLAAAGGLAWVVHGAWRRSRARRPRPHLAVDPEAGTLTLSDPLTLRAPEVVALARVSAVWVGPAVPQWLAGERRPAEPGLNVGGEEPLLLLAFDPPVVLGAARRAVPRSRGPHATVPPLPDRPVRRLWIAVRDPLGAYRTFERLPVPARWVDLGVARPEQLA